MRLVRWLHVYRVFGCEGLMDYGEDKEDKEYKEWRDVSAVGLVTKRRRGDGVGGRGFGQVAGDGMRRWIARYGLIRRGAANKMMGGRVVW